MTERNPIPACLSHLEQFRQATLERAEAACDLTAPTGGGLYSQGWIAARESCRKAIRALLRGEP
jgi:hypothetical protein